jgi:hypothetical protein
MLIFRRYAYQPSHGPIMLTHNARIDIVEAMRTGECLLEPRNPGLYCLGEVLLELRSLTAHVLSFSIFATKWRSVNMLQAGVIDRYFEDLQFSSGLVIRQRSSLRSTVAARLEGFVWLNRYLTIVSVSPPTKGFPRTHNPVNEFNA